MPTIEEIREKLKTIVDPEINFNIVDLGLVYGIYLEGNNLKVDFTLTTPYCPYGPHLIAQIPKVISESFPEIENTDVKLVWVPSWDPRKMATDDVKLELGIFDDDDDDEELNK